MGIHRCFACNESNPDRIVNAAGDGWTLQFAERFAAVPGRVQGGIAIGALTCPALQVAGREGMLHPVPLQVTGRLNRPISLGNPLRGSVDPADGGFRVQVHEDSNVILDGLVKVADLQTEPGSMLQEAPPERAGDLKVLTELIGAEIDGHTISDHWRQSYEAAGLPLLQHKCFGCSEAEGTLKLRLRIARRGIICTRWEPETDFTDGEGRLAAAIIASALDCATIYTVNAEDLEFMARMLREKRSWTTGTYGVRFLRVPPVKMAGGYIIAARYLGREELKFFAMSALFDHQGAVYSIGEAVLIFFNFRGESPFMKEGFAEIA
jgi:hypothetical protein